MRDVADDIRDDIEATRADLDEKIQQLTEKAHEAMDVRHHVARRPWVALGIATAAGFLLGGRGRHAAAPHDAAPRSPIVPGRHDLGLLGDAAVLLLTSLAKNAFRGRLQAVAAQDDRRTRRRASGKRRAPASSERVASSRNGGEPA
jgi:hypothetical protein